MSNFHVGQKIECVSIARNRDAQYRYAAAYGHKLVFPKVGEVFIVRDADIHANGTPVIRLFEIVNPSIPYKNFTGEVWMASEHFRAVVERKTDISVFTAMLHTQRTRVPA